MGRRNATNVSVTNDDATLDVDHGNSVVNNTSTTKTETTIASKKVNEDNSLPLANEGDALVADSNGIYQSQAINTIIGGATLLTQGYYGLLTDFYFGGSATETIIDLNNVNTWVDVDIDVSTDGLFDNRPQDMIDAQAIGHDGGGSANDPVVFKLEGLDLRSFANFRASMAFEPEDDEGQLESRLLFNRHSGTTPSEDFPIEEVSLSMFNGADVDYVSEPMLSFFIGDTIDTNGAGDAGKCRFQIKSNVTGIIKLRALTWYINK
tara:strand:+ start:1372 stop:2163 length:792 start_codon:yes stop_codon:yes gene_type:complete